MRDDGDPLAQFWEGDHLNRRAEAAHLGEYLRARYAAKQDEKGFVLAVNAEWGVGKTFMLTKWVEQLRFEKHPVVYFDAWANDFTPEPLVAFIADVNEGLEGEFKHIPAAKKLLGEWLKAGKRALVPTLKAVAGLAVGQATGAAIHEAYTAWSDGGEGNHEAAREPYKLNASRVAEQLTKAVSAALKEHTNTRKAITACRDKLALLVEHLQKTPGVQLPIYIMVDELDRCRPDYAIQLLEGIKHLFGVPGVYFVVGTNIPQLAHSVAVVYGDKFDGARYLKRFFDLEYSLPNPDGELFAKDLLQSLMCRPDDENLVTGMRPEFWGNKKVTDYLSFLFAHYATGFSLSLRDQHGAARILDAALLGLKGQRVHIHFLLFLVMLYQRSPTIYHQVDLFRVLGSQSSYDTLKRPPGAGVFQILQLNNNNAWSEKKSVPIESIAGQYIEYIQRPPKTRDGNMYTFPQNLMGILLDPIPGQRDNVAEYFDVVRLAGRFSGNPM